MDQKAEMDQKAAMISPIPPLTSHEFSDSLLTWDPRYRANETNPISAQAQPAANVPISVPFFYRASWLHSGVQPLPSANHLQLRNNGLFTETVTGATVSKVLEKRVHSFCYIIKYFCAVGYAEEFR